ncbi:hypothetical protein [Streptomyces sp. 8L]|uniref:hypothetical protein n=1 Tax=Streptomyces sp. 8L TaxID=2877242 RepID=UPI001CD41D7E|nr:hypothetical protein [Streptomyces sp. 8L]MCA1218289.1 hypothetical protein [Streptomyces sp. 8L]
MNDDDYPDHGEPPIRSALLFPPCTCGRPVCPDLVAQGPAPEGRSTDGRPADSRSTDDRSVSPTMRRLRPQVEEANRRAKQRGRQ